MIYTLFIISSFLALSLLFSIIIYVLLIIIYILAEISRILLLLTFCSTYL